MKLIALWIVGLLLWLIPKTAAQTLPTPQIGEGIRIDHRQVKLENFFNNYGCQKPNYAQNYISAADKVNLDYRLLPAISIIESQCGKRQLKNNWWGWNSARTGFKSVAEGIDFVSRQLADGRYYKGLTIEQKLGRYNSVNPTYLKKVLSIMQKIDAE